MSTFRSGRNGKPRYRALFRDARGVVTSRTLPRLKDAEALLEEMHRRSRERTLPDVSKSRRTMTDLWEHFTKTHRGKPSTFASYEARWTKHIEPVLGKRRLRTLDRDDIEEFYEDLEKRTSLDTRRKVQQVIHKMLAVAVRSKWLVNNPADGIPMPQAVAQREPRPLTEVEVDKLADAVPSRYRALAYMLAEAGALVLESCWRCG